jgi:hypothetical protein
MKKDDFGIYNSKLCGWYITNGKYLWKDLTLHKLTFEKGDVKDATGYYHSKQEAEETLNKFLETKMLKIGDKVKVLKNAKRGAYPGRVGVIQCKCEYEGYDWRVKFVEPYITNNTFLEYELEKINELPTQEEIIEAAKESDEAALEISIRKWEVLSEMSDEKLKKLTGLYVGDTTCGLCQRKKYLNRDSCNGCCLEYENNCCKEWVICRHNFINQNYPEFRKSAKILTERLEAELQKERDKMGTKDSNIKERLEQNKIDTERLLEEKAKLEKQQLEESKKKPIRNGDYGRNDTGTRLLFLAPRNEKMHSYSREGHFDGNADDCLSYYTVLGNIFDDLENKKGGM